MSLSNVIFPSGTYRVTRRDAGTYTSGNYNPFPAVDADVTAFDLAANTLTIVGHNMVTGQGPLFPTTTITLPTNLLANTVAWAIRVDANTIKLAASRAAAMALTAIDLVDVGAGVLHLSSSFNIVAGVQPVTGELLKEKPEAMEVDETRVVYTTTKLQSIADPDIISIDGEDWLVTKVEPFLILARRYRAWVERLKTP